MKGRQLAIIFVLLVSLPVVGVQLLDPELTQDDPTAVDLSESPSEIASDAVRNLSQRDFTYVMLITANRTPNSRTDGLYRRVKVENTEEEYYSKVPVGDTSQYMYGNNVAYWMRIGEEGSWEFGMRPDYVYPVRGLTQPFSVSKIQNTSGEIVHENSSMLVVRLDTAGTTMQSDTDLPGDYTLIHFDKRKNRIDRAVFKLNNSKWRPKYVHLRITAVDETDVQRPPNTRPSLKAFLMDILRGPLFRVP